MDMRYIDNVIGEFKGYDNNMILSPTSYKLFDEQKLGLVAIAENDKLSMNVYTDQPDMQPYWDQPHEALRRDYKPSHKEFSASITYAL